MPKRDRGASLTDLLAEATGDVAETSVPESTPIRPPEPTRPAKRGRARPQPETQPTGHARASDGSYVRADGAKRVSLQLKMDPEDKRALKMQAAAEGLSPAEYVARLVQEDALR